MRTDRGKLLLLLLLFGAMLFSGCATTGGPAPAEEAAPFVAVVPKEGDTLQSLAKRHLDDPSKAWMIAEFNEVDQASPGHPLIVPRIPYAPGGLTPDGYQLVPILVYHHITPDTSDKMSVKLEDFEAQMQLLRDEGYHVVSLPRLYEFMEMKAQIPRRSVVITFDDGWRSFHELAMPVLKRFGYPATLFIYTDLIVGSSKTLSWDMVREIAEAGFDIQCHSRTHRNLARLNPGEEMNAYLSSLEDELVGSARVIEERTGVRTRFLAYPYGTTNPLVTEMLRKHDFLGAFTVKRGGVPVFSDFFRVNRSMVYGDYTLDQFREQITVFQQEEIL